MPHRVGKAVKASVYHNMQAQSGSIGIAVFSLNLSNVWSWVVSAAILLGKSLVPIVQGARWAP